MKKSLSFLSFLIISSLMVQAQEVIKGATMSKVSEVIQVPSLASRMSEFEPYFPQGNGPVKDGRSSKIEVEIGKGAEIENDVLASNPHFLEGAIQARTPQFVFEAVISGSQPTDPSLAVGPNHIVSVFNSGIRIFDRQGNPLTGQINAQSIFPAANICCDLTVSHDPIADRYIMSILYLNSTVRMAVSMGPDPVNDGWFIITVPNVRDYNKLSIWSDGYYITEQGGGGPPRLVIVNRDQALMGSANTQIQSVTLPGFLGSGAFNSFQVANAGDSNFPPVGNATAIYFTDDAWASATADELRLWDIDVDWTNAANTTLTGPSAIPMAPAITVFDGGSFSNLDQPGGTDIDVLQSIIMNQAQYRKFDTHNSLVFCLTVDTDVSPAEKAGIRWYELRQTADGQPWTLYQEGTYVSPGNFHVWNGSMAIDSFGNIGLGYSKMTTDGTGFVDLAYTGRRASDPLGTMTLAEEVFVTGTTAFPNVRYGDYAKMDLDPTDERTFYFISEVFEGNRKNVVAAFDLGFEFDNDLGIVAIQAPAAEGDFGASETVTVSIQSYSNQPQSNFPISIAVDGTVAFTENFTGTINPGTTVTHTFTNTLDLSTEGQEYEITAATALVGDQDTSNDAFTASAKHLFDSDVGVVRLVSPESAENLGMETVAVEVRNFGAVAQSGFPVSYQIDGGTPITETFTGTLAPGATAVHTFGTTGDFSVPKTYTVRGFSGLSGDGDAVNNGIDTEVINISCFTFTNSTSASIGPNAGTITESIINIANDFEVSDIDVTLNVTHPWLSNLDVKITAPDGTEVILANDIGFNRDDFVNTVFDQEASESINDGTAPYTGSFIPQGDLSTLYGSNSLGDFKLTIEDDTNNNGGTLNNWSLKLCRADAPLSIGSVDSNKGKLAVYKVAERTYQIRYNGLTSQSKVNMNVYNVSGQVLKFKTLYPNGANNIEETLDMSYAPSGTYIIQIGDSFKKILVN